jgi:hypothetical protein
MIYTIDAGKVKVEKYKGTRKTETVIYELSTLRNLNK